MKLRNLLLMITCLGINPLGAQAQSGGRGGGAGIICNDPHLGPTSLTVLDYYEAVKPFIDPKQGWVQYDQDNFAQQPNANYENEGGFAFSGYDNLAYKMIFRGMGDFGTLSALLVEKLSQVGLPSTWAPARLQVMGDLHLEYEIPKGCQVFQIAKRENGKFFADPRYLMRLSSYQLGVLQYHETVYSLAYDLNQTQSAATIRNLFRPAYGLARTRELKNDDSTTDAQTLNRLSKQIGLTFGQSYLNRAEDQLIQEFEKLFFQTAPMDEVQKIKFDQLKWKLVDLLKIHRNLNPKENDFLVQLIASTPSSVTFPR